MGDVPSAVKRVASGATLTCLTPGVCRLHAPSGQSRDRAQ